MSVYIFSGLFVLYAYILFCHDCAIDKSSARIKKIEESIEKVKKFTDSLKDDSQFLSQVNNRVWEQKKSIEAINKVLIELKKHTGLQVKEVADNVAKEFTGENS